MKKTFVLLTVIVGIMVPFSVQADPGSSSTGDARTPGKAKAKSSRTVAVPSKAEVVYITNRSVTGSHLPLVVCRYNGRYNNVSTVSLYGRPELDRTGQLNVGSELNQTDPAISSVGVGGRR